MLLVKVEPEYSDEARRAKYQGTVEVGFTIGEDGEPRDLKVLHSLGLGLDEKAIEAVGKWRFKPAYRDGRPASFPGSAQIDFRLL